MTPPQSSNRHLYLFYTALFLFFGVFVIVKTQFWIPTLWEADGYYHIQSANLIRTQGFIKEFHWAKYSFFATRFADKDLLYHILLIPFAYFQNIFLGAKVAASLSALFLFLTYFFLLKRYSQAKFVPIFLVLFFLSHYFLSALNRPRPMILAIALMILGIHFLIRKNSWGIFLTTLLYGFLHITALMMLFFSFLIETLRFLDPTNHSLLSLESGGASSSFKGRDRPIKKFFFKPILVTFFALIFSYLLHPHFPNNLLYIWLNLFKVPYYAAKGGILELGGEFFPISTRDFLMGYPVILPAIFVLISCTIFLFCSPSSTFSLKDQNKIRFETKIFFFCSIPLLFGSFLSQRYLIHCYPLFLIWLAAHFSDLFSSKNEKEKGMIQSSIVITYGLRTVLFLGLFLGSCLTYQGLKGNARIEQIVNSHYESVGNWMKKNLPPGETIFHANWSDSQYLIGLNPNNDYFVTLDPIYMYEWNQKLYNLYRDVAHGRTTDPYTILKDVFHVRYGYIGRNYFSRLIFQVAQDKRFAILAEDNLGVIFMLDPPIVPNVIKPQ